MKDLILLISAILWLCHRATRLLKVPAPSLIHILGIDIPETPQVSVDNVTDSTVSIHWSKPSGTGSLVVKYIVEVDSQKVGETDRADSNVTLKNLTANKSYVIRVSAVNASNYRSHNSTLYVHTKVSRDEGLPSTVNPIIGITSDSGLKRSRASSKNLRPSGLKISDRNTGDKNSTDKVYTVEALTNEVEGIQIEISDLLAQASAAELEFNGAEEVLMRELEELKERKKQDDQQRSSIRSEAKSLDDSKRAFEIQRAKLDRRCHSLESELEKRKTCQENWHQEIAEAKFRIGELEQNIDHLNDENVRDLDNIKSMIETYQSELNQLDDDIKGHNQSLKRSEQSKNATLEALSIVRKKMDPVTLLLPEGEDVLNDVLAQEGLDDYFKEWLEKELDLDKQLEDDWQKVQKDLEVRYLKVHEQYEEATKTFKNTQQQAAMARTSTLPSSSAMESISMPSMLVGPSMSTVTTSPPHTAYSGSKHRTFSSDSGGSGLNGVQSSGYQLFDSPIGMTSLATTNPASGAALRPTSSAVSRTIADEPLPNLLLPTDLFGGDDITESIQKFFNEQRDTRDFTDNSSIHKNQAFVSPKQSLLSFRAAGDRDSANISTFETSPPTPPNPQIFPTASFNTTVSSNISMAEEDNAAEASSQDSKEKVKKFPSMFFFGRNQNNAKGNDGKHHREMDNNNNSLVASTSLTANESLFSNRPRAGSYSSALSSKTPSINPNDVFFSTWRDNGTVGDIWSDKDWAGNDPVAYTQDSKKKRDKSDRKSTERKSSEGFASQFLVSPGKKGRKGFVGLFERSPGPVSPEKPEKGDKTDKKTIASLFGKTNSNDDLPEAPPHLMSLDVDETGHSSDLLTSEPYLGSFSSSPGDQSTTSTTFLQKSMRSFGSRKSVSSTSSSKFVRKLSIFGKKDKDDDEDDDDEVIVEENGELQVEI